MSNEWNKDIFKCDVSKKKQKKKNAFSTAAVYELNTDFFILKILVALSNVS